MALKLFIPSGLRGFRSPPVSSDVRCLPFWLVHIQRQVMDETTILFRPADQKELELIRQSDFTAFPPRLPEQPIFYPVLNEV